MKVEEEIRTLLRDKADEVPMHGSLPAPLRRRVRTRIAINTSALGAVVIVVIAGAVVGANELSKPSAAGFEGPNGSATTATTPAACTAGQLRAVGTLQGAAGSRIGSITLTNLSNKTCTLTGTPTVRLLDKNLHPITSGIAFGTSPANWQANALSKPSGWPVVTLAPFKAAMIRVRWDNWCPQGRTAPMWQVVIPHSTPVNVNGFEAQNPPPCNGSGVPSTVDRGPFEPARAA
jgi:hypothetical protein